MNAAVLAALTVREIFAPTVVGVPPTFATRDMCRTECGEIRHYGHDNSGPKPRHVYAVSSDEGMNWTIKATDEGDPGAMVKSPWSGDWIYFKGLEPVMLVRSKNGPGSVGAISTPMPWRRLELRQLTPLVKRRRWLAAFSNVLCENGECYHATTAYSDDDGRTWTRTDLKPVADVARLAHGDKRPHWFNNGCEPTFAELCDGTILLCVRTSGPHAAFFRSKDGGATWGEGAIDESFWQANTMPYYFRLSDGRLLFIWNNTQMLPTRDASEYPELDTSSLAGKWESVFTNRDVLHAAISDDDGRTWHGFRELALNEIRNAADFREIGNGPFEENDKSVHQTQALELKGGKVLLAYGQGRAARRLMVFDPDWLLETSRHEDFRYGLGGVSTHLYVRSLSGGFSGWSGHCAWTRVSGALMVRDPDTDDPPAGRERSRREVLQLCRIRDPRLVCDRQGVVWNFPAARTGRLTLDCRIAGAGFRMTLSDHWMNPCDEINPPLCPFSEKMDDAHLRSSGWHLLSVEWSEDLVRIYIDGQDVGCRRLAVVPKFGLSYLHLQTLADRADPKGTYFRSFDFNSEKPKSSP